MEGKLDAERTIGHLLQLTSAYMNRHASKSARGITTGAKLASRPPANARLVFTDGSTGPLMMMMLMVMMTIMMMLMVIMMRMEESDGGKEDEVMMVMMMMMMMMIFMMNEDDDDDE